MTLEYTPGPWEASKSIISGDWVISAADGTTLIAREVRHFNAPVLAASPELLEACQELIIEMDIVNVPSLHVMELIRKAVAKATS